MNCQKCGCPLPEISVDLTQNVFTCPGCLSRDELGAIKAQRRDFERKIYEETDRDFYPHNAMAKAKSMREALIEQMEKEEAEK